MTDDEVLREFLEDGLNCNVSIVLKDNEVITGTLVSVREKFIQIRTEQGRRLVPIDKISGDISINDEPSIPATASPQNNAVYTVPTTPALTALPTEILHTPQPDISHDPRTKFLSSTSQNGKGTVHGMQPSQFPVTTTQPVDESIFLPYVSSELIDASPQLSPDTLASDTLPSDQKIIEMATHESVATNNGENHLIAVLDQTQPLSTHIDAEDYGKHEQEATTDPAVGLVSAEQSLQNPSEILSQELIDIEKRKQGAEIDAALLMITSRLSALTAPEITKLEIQPPSEIFLEELKPRDIRSKWQSIQQSYDNAKEINELGSKYGRIQPLILRVEELLPAAQRSAGLRRYLAYFHYLARHDKDAIKIYEEATFLTCEPQDWYNVAALCFKTPSGEAEAMHALTQIFITIPITDVQYRTTWFMLIRLIDQLQDYEPFHVIYKTSTRTLSEEEEQNLFQAIVYLFMQKKQEDFVRRLIEGMVEKRVWDGLLQDAMINLPTSASLYQKMHLEWEGARRNFQEQVKSPTPASGNTTGVPPANNESMVYTTRKASTPSPQVASALLMGTIVLYKKSRNYGFIQGPEGIDYFFHRGAVTDDDLLQQLQRLPEERLPSNGRISVTFAVTPGRPGLTPAAVNVSCQRDSKTVFNLATNYANEGDYSRALMYIKRVLAVDPQYPNVQQLYDTWREYARATDIPRGTTLYARARRKQLLERDLEGAIDLFCEAIQQNDSLEKAVKDLAGVLMQLGRHDKAIQVLNQNRPKIKDHQPIDNLLIEAYQRSGLYEQAIRMLRPMYDSARQAGKKAPLGWRIATCHMRKNDYLGAASWFQKVIKLNINVKAAQRNLALCLTKLDRYEEAEKLLCENLPDPESEAVLEAIRQARTTGQSIQLDPSPMTLADFSSEISTFTRFFLQRCDFEGVPSLKAQEKSFTRDDVQHLEDLASRLGTRRPRERGEYYLSAARIIYDKGEEWEDDYSLFFRYLCRCFASRGDAAIIENRTVDAAREWYCEALRVYDGDRGHISDEQDAVNALIRFLFATVGRANVPVNEKRRIDESLELILQSQSQPDKVFDAIAYLVIHSQFAAKRILNRLWAIQFRGMALEYLQAKGIGQSNDFLTQNDFLDRWRILQLRELEREHSLTIELRFVQQRVEFSVASVQESHRRLQAIEANLYFDLDRKRVAELQRVLETMHDLCIQSTFEEKERLCLQIDSRCKDLWREIEADPTRLSIESFHPIAQTIEAKTREYLEHLYESSAPQLVLRLPEGMTSYNQDAVNPSVEVQIVVGNKAGCSPAEAIELVILEDETWFTIESPETKLEEGSLRGGEQRIIRVPIRVTQKALQSQAFSLSSYAQYRTRSEEIVRTPVMAFSISLYSAEHFERVHNPYALYAQGGIVGDEAMFYGRSELIEKVTQTISSSRTQSKAIIIFGQKRSGKTSILYHLGRRLQYFPDLLVLDLGSMAKYWDEYAKVPLFHQILWGILSNLNERIREEIQQGRPPLNITFPSRKEFYHDLAPSQSFQEYLSDFQKLTEQDPAWHATRLVLLIDEFSYLYGWIMKEQLSEDFMKNWKGLLQDNLFSVVLAGQDVMPKFKEKFPNDFGIAQDERVSYLQREDARKLIDEPIRIGGEGGKSRYRERAIDRIVDLTASNPFYIQIICDRLVEYMNRKCAPLVTEADVEQVKQELIHQGANPLGWDKFDNLTSSGDDSPDAITQEDARAVLKAIATNSRTGPCSRSRILVDTQKEIDVILQDLVQREVIETHPGNCYTIRVGLFKDWLLAHQ